jgi:hypothetical protein
MINGLMSRKNLWFMGSALLLGLVFSPYRTVAVGWQFHSDSTLEVTIGPTYNTTTEMIWKWEFCFSLRINERTWLLAMSVHLPISKA